MGSDKSIISCIYHYSIIQNRFAILKFYWALPIDLFFYFPELLATAAILNVSLVLPFLQCHVVGTIWYVTFSDWLLLLKQYAYKVSSVIHGLTAYFFFKSLNSIPLCGCTNFFFIHSPNQRTPYLLPVFGNWD